MLSIQRSWVNQFLAWILPFAFGAALAEGLAFAVFNEISLGLTSAVMLMCGVMLVYARRFALHNDITRSVAISCGALLASAILIALFQPTLFPALIFVPLMVAALALPYTNDQLLRWLLAASWLASMLVALASGPSYAHNNQITPNWFVAGFQLTSLSIAVALVLLLLWQYRRRLTAVLLQTRAAEQRYSLAAQGANDGLWDWDLISNVVYFSTRWKSMLGYTDAQIGETPADWLTRLHPDDRPRVEAELAVHLDHLTPHFESEYRICDVHGRYRWMLCRGLAVRDANGIATRMAGSQTDITARKLIEDQLRRDALHDTLTGIANRAHFLDRLEWVLARMKREPGYGCTVLFADLDRFKVVNDSLGHGRGDDLLVQVVQRWQTCLRPSDTFARLGGDEFTILLDGVTTVSGATLVADRLQAALKSPFTLDGVDVFTSASIGIALCTSPNLRPEEVLRDADSALYHAKARGKACYALFDQAMYQEAITRLQLETELRHGIERREFVVFYQPIVSLEHDALTGFEALVRWQHPQRGLVMPNEFIPLAEETGLISQLGMQVLYEACRQARIWASQSAYPPPTVSVNVSGAQLVQPDFAAQVRACISNTQVDPRLLCIEITESIMMENARVAADMLQQIRALGVRIAIDDFGTGYSSLGVLRQMPIDTLKIDRGFLQSVGTDHGHGQLVQTIIHLAHNLGMDVVAEGIESETQLRYLRTIGCDRGQGYLFARPQALAELAPLLTRPQISIAALTAISA